MAEFLKEERVKSKIEHPFFCVWVLVALLVIMHMSFTCIPRLKGRVTSSQKLVISLWLVFLVAILQTLLIEPDTQVDQAMHTFEGKLPDLVVFEDEEPVDALLRWGKIAAKEHLDENWTPIVRQPIYYEILDELCNQTETLTCTRTRAWEFLNMGAMAFTGNDYPIDYYNQKLTQVLVANVYQQYWMVRQTHAFIEQLVSFVSVYYHRPTIVQEILLNTLHLNLRL